MTISAQTVLAGVKSILAEMPGPLIVLWLQVATRRSELKAQIIAERQGEPIVPIILRGDGFRNANALLSDFVAELDNERESFEIFRHSGVPKLAVVLLSLDPLGIPQVSSPATLPDWFPIAGGEVVEVYIRDLARTSNTSLNATECKVPEISAGLHRLETALLIRLDSQAQKNAGNNWGASFFDRIKDEKKTGESYRDFLRTALEFNRGITNPSGYRPSARSAESLIGRLMRLVSSTSPDELSSRAKSMCVALAFTPTVKTPDSMISVVLRPTNPTDEAGRFGRNVLISVYSATQFVTAAAHADDYPMYSLPLLQGVSFDIRSTLEILAQALEAQG